MPDPFDSFQLPSELRELLAETDQQTLREEILDIHVRLLKRDPELEDNRGRGLHLWLLFNAIATRLRSQPDFREHVVPTVIPTFVEHGVTGQNWFRLRLGRSMSCNRTRLRMSPPLGPS
jgi:hypothetical protein